MEQEAEAAAERAEASRRAAAASVEAAGARVREQREAAQGLILDSELSQQGENMEQAIRQQQLRRMRMLVSGLTQLCTPDLTQDQTNNNTTTATMPVV